VPNVQQKTPDDEQRRCPKRVETYNNKFWIISAFGWLFKKKSITMHGNIKLILYELQPAKTDVESRWFTLAEDAFGVRSNNDAKPSAVPH